MCPELLFQSCRRSQKLIEPGPASLRCQESIGARERVVTRGCVAEDLQDFRQSVSKSQCLGVVLPLEAIPFPFKPVRGLESSDICPPVVRTAKSLDLDIAFVEAGCPLTNKLLPLVWRVEVNLVFGGMGAPVSGLGLRLMLPGVGASNKTGATSRTSLDSGSSIWRCPLSTVCF